MTDETSTREQIGGNNPPTGTAMAQLPFLAADELNKRLPEQFSGLSSDVTELLAEIRAQMPAEIQTDSDNEIAARFMERLRSTIKRVTGHHAVEKEPYLSSGRQCDQFFFGMRDRMAKARDIIQARGDDFTERKAAAARLKLRQEQEAAAAEARRLAEAARQAEAERIEAEQRAARARKPENIAQHEQVAETKATQAALLQVDEMIAASKADDAMIAAAQPTAELVRTRFESGNLATGRTKDVVEIIDSDLLDKDALWPHIPEDIKLRALKAWAKATNHKKQMAGATITKREGASYR